MPPSGELKIDMDVVNRILNLLLDYWKPGSAGGAYGFLSVSVELDDEETEHPREFAKANQIYIDRYAPRKTRKNRGAFHAS